MITWFSRFLVDCRACTADMQQQIDRLKLQVLNLEQYPTAEVQSRCISFVIVSVYVFNILTRLLLLTSTSISILHH